VAAVVALVAGVGISKVLGVSPLLTCLVMGFVQTNITKARRQLVDSVFADFEPVILVVFFTLAGMHLSFDHVVLAGLAALLLFGARAAGKLLAARVAMRVAGATEALRSHLGMALIPQAGVAVGLVLLIQEDSHFAEVVGFFSAVVLTVVTVNEIVGPILTRVALARAGEVDSA
jgi:Kef-type K+ transport system membrane component KefB